MNQIDRLNDLLRRATRSRSRVVWTKDVIARRAPDQESYLIIGGPGPVAIGTALVEVKVPKTSTSGVAGEG